MIMQYAETDNSETHYKSLLVFPAGQDVLLSWLSFPGCQRLQNDRREGQSWRGRWGRRHGIWGITTNRKSVNPFKRLTHFCSFPLQEVHFPFFSRYSFSQAYVTKNLIILNFLLANSHNKATCDNFLLEEPNWFPTQILFHKSSRSDKELTSH